MHSAEVVVFGQKWLYSGKSGCIGAKVVVFGPNGCIRSKVVLFGQLVVFKMVVLRRKMF